MHDPGHPTDTPAEARYNFLRPRRRSSRVVPAAIAGILLLLAGGTAWYLLHRPGPDPARDVTPTPASGEAAAPQPAAPPIDLPPLDASDDLVRTLVTGIFSHPRIAAWLAHEALIHRFAAAVADIANGLDPRPNLRFLAPDGDFRVRQSGGHTFIDPASYQRYDLLTATFVSFDPDDAARLYRQLHPLFEQAYRDLGVPQPDFDQAMASAIERLLAVPIPNGPIQVVPRADGTGFAFADPALERQSDAAKQLLRLGPDNARRIQAKLRQLASALRLPADPRD